MRQPFGWPHFLVHWQAFDSSLKGVQGIILMSACRQVFCFKKDWAGAVHKRLCATVSFHWTISCLWCHGLHPEWGRLKCSVSCNWRSCHMSLAKWSTSTFNCSLWGNCKWGMSWLRLPFTQMGCHSRRLSSKWFLVDFFHQIIVGPVGVIELRLKDAD